MDTEPVIYVNEAKIFSAAIVGELQKHYRNLDVRSGASGGLDFVVGDLTQTQIKDLQSDIEFFQQNPHVPKENVCCHFWNYQPKNKSQEELVQWAKTLLAIQDQTVTAGLYIVGSAGVGKSHIALAVAKELMKDGQEAYFISGEKMSPTLQDGQVRIRPGGKIIDLGSNQVWVIDDLNAGYGVAGSALHRIVLNAHEKGGRVFVTSNSEYEEVLNQSFAGNQEEKPRFEDRTRGMFKILHVEGESARQAGAWYQKVQASELRDQLSQAVSKEDYEEATRLRDLIKVDEKKGKDS